MCEQMCEAACVPAQECEAACVCLLACLCTSVRLGRFSTGHCGGQSTCPLARSPTPTLCSPQAAAPVRRPPPPECTQGGRGQHGLTAPPLAPVRGAHPMPMHHRHRWRRCLPRAERTPCSCTIAPNPMHRRATAHAGWMAEVMAPPRYRWPRRCLARAERTPCSCTVAPHPNLILTPTLTLTPI